VTAPPPDEKPTWIGIAPAQLTLGLAPSPLKKQSALRLQVVGAVATASVAVAFATAALAFRSQTIVVPHQRTLRNFGHRTRVAETELEIRRLGLSSEQATVTLGGVDFGFREPVIPIAPGAMVEVGATTPDGRACEALPRTVLVPKGQRGRVLIWCHGSFTPPARPDTAAPPPRPE
jgi:hypothetical protein